MPLFIIVLSQFLGTSLWFTPNGIASSLVEQELFTFVEVGYLTSAVQMGFIVGTLLIAFSGYADRFRASRIFFFSALVGALFNTLFIFTQGLLPVAVLCRFMTGVALAGIYPIGMKLVVSWYPLKTGHALGWLVGMLTLGTGFPHAMQAVGGSDFWQLPVVGASVFAIVAGVLVLKLGEGEHLPLRTTVLTGKVLTAFSLPSFRSAALAYFGHCWELYAFWALVPMFVISIFSVDQFSSHTVSWISFSIIGIGFFGCLVAGWMSREWGSAKTAFIMLLISGLICLLWPLIGGFSKWFLLLVLLIWGFTVIADSAQYSALAAQACPKEYVGSALALMNSIGFFMTAVSISLVTYLYPLIQSWVAWIMLLGPAIGLVSLVRLIRVPL